MDTNRQPTPAHGGALLRIGDASHWYGEAKTAERAPNSLPPLSWNVLRFAAAPALDACLK